MTTERLNEKLRAAVAESAAKRGTTHPMACACKGSGLLPVAQFANGYAPCASPSAPSVPREVEEALREAASRLEESAREAEARVARALDSDAPEGTVKFLRANADSIRAPADKCRAALRLLGGADGGADGKDGT